jgi:hypothetical protein
LKHIAEEKRQAEVEEIAKQADIHIIIKRREAGTNQEVGGVCVVYVVEMKRWPIIHRMNFLSPI